jgi:hypothetical protein
MLVSRVAAKLVKGCFLTTGIQNKIFLNAATGIQGFAKTVTRLLGSSG